MSKANANILLPLVALVVTFICFYPTLDNDFVNWDDQDYVERNWLIKDLNAERINKIITTPEVVGSYTPLTMLSFALDYKLGNGSPKPFHITNLILHLTSVILVFWWMKVLTKRVEIAFICALLFGIHPLHVEPVAWVSSRKDTLYAFFYILALVCYTYYAQGKRKAMNYAFVIVLFFCSVASKGVAVVLPVALLLIDHLLERKRWVYLLLEKVPFFLIGLLFGLLAIRGQQEGTAMLEFSDYPFYQTAFVGAYGFLWYIFSALVPYKLAALHPYPFEYIMEIQWYFYASIVPLLAIIVLSIVYGRKNKHFVFGFGFFTFGIIHLLKILPYGRGMVAERYTYIPYIGFFYLLAWVFVKIKDGDWQVPVWAKRLLLVLGICWMGVLSVMTFLRTDVWQNGGVMWLDVAHKYPKHFFAWSCAGDYYYQHGEYHKAFELIDKSIGLNDEFSDAFNNRGKIYEKFGKPELAFEDYNKSIELDPFNFGSYLNRAILYLNLYNDTASAWQDLNKAIAARPTYCLAYLNRGVFYEMQGEFEKAEADYNMAIRLEPNNAKHYRYRGLLKFYTGDRKEALQDFNTALRYKPDYGNVYYLRSRIYKDNGEIEKAKADVTKAMQLGYQVDPNYLKELNQ